VALALALALASISGLALASMHPPPVTGL